MNETKCKQTHQYFQQEKHECQRQIAILQADHRADEAVFLKIRLNMFEIFHSVFTVGENTAGNDDGKLKAFFEDRLLRIPQNWKMALEKAERHENSEAAYIENIKLDTVAQISNAFHQIWEEEQ